MIFRLGDDSREVDALTRPEGGWTLAIAGAAQPASVHAHGHGLLTATLGERRVAASVIAAGDRRHVFVGGRVFALQFIDPLGLVGAEHEEEGSGLVSPMPGKVIALLAKPGAAVEKGAPLLVLEAMKMEHTISAPRAGTLRSYRFAAGDQVDEGVELVEFD
jgi:3-methylcrotonyl-CoA carboxylase alpha subunit